MGGDEGWEAGDGRGVVVGERGGREGGREGEIQEGGDASREIGEEGSQQRREKGIDGGERESEQGEASCAGGWGEGEVATSK